MNLSPVFAETAIMDIIAIASTRSAIGPNSGTMNVPMISISPVPSEKGIDRVLSVGVVLVSWKSVFYWPSFNTKNLSSV